MFIRKLFNVGDKAKWLILELLIVFVGVYLAFLFQNYAEDRKLGQEKDKVLMSLKAELEEFRASFPDYADYQEGMLEEWDSLIDLNETASFYSWRYLEPQYNFKIIEYALDQKGTEVISFDLYQQLSRLHAFIKRTEHAERRMTEFGDQYLLVPNSLDENDKDRRIMEAQNRLYFFKFMGAARDRTGNLRMIAKLAGTILESVNAQLGPEKVKEAELIMLKDLVDAGFNKERILRVYSNYFDHLLKKRLKATSINGERISLHQRIQIALTRFYQQEVSRHL